MKRMKRIICALLVMALILSQTAGLALAAEDAPENGTTNSETSTEDSTNGEADDEGVTEEEDTNNDTNDEESTEDGTTEDNTQKGDLPVYSGPMTLDFAIEAALANNGKVLAAANDLEKAKLERDKVLRDAEDFYIAVGEPTPGKIDQTPAYYKVLVYAVDMAKKQVEMCEHAYDMAVASTKLSVITQYYTIANHGKTEVYTVAAYENAVRSYDNAKLLYDYGMIARVDLMGAELQMNSARQTALNSRVNTNKAKRTLLAQIGYEPTSSFSVATPMEYVPLEAMDKDAVVKDLIENSPAVAISKTSYDIAGIQYENDSRFRLDYSYNAQVALATYKSAENDYKQTMLEAKANSYNMLDTLEDAERVYTTSLAALDSVKETYEIAKLQYQYGLITFTDVKMAEAEIYSTEAQIYGALMQYCIMQTALENKIIVTQ